MRGRCITARNARGFTLIELTVAMVLTVVVLGMATLFLQLPVDAYSAQTRRADLVDGTESVTRRIAADLKNALPRSVRTRVSGTRTIIEMLVVPEGGMVFYTTAGADPLTINAGADTSFIATGRFLPDQPRPLVLNNFYLAIPTTNAPPASQNPYTAINRSVRPIGQITITPAGLAETVALNPGFNFQYASPTGRIFLARPVAYICDTAAAARTVRRFDNYNYAAAAPTAATAAPLNGAAVNNALIASDVLTCAARCNQPNGICTDDLILDMTVGVNVNGGNEVVHVFYKFPANMP